MSIPFQSSIISGAILFLLKDADRKGLIKDIVEKIDKIADQNLEKKSEKVQLEVIAKVLIPIAKEMMEDADAETKRAYLGLVAIEFSRLDQELRRLDSERQKKVAK